MDTTTDRRQQQIAAISRTILEYLKREDLTFEDVEVLNNKGWTVDINVSSQRILHYEGVVLSHAELRTAWNMIHTITLKEARAECGINEATLRRACWEGRLPAQKRGGAWWVDRDDLRQWLKGFKPKPRTNSKTHNFVKSG